MLEYTNKVWTNSEKNNTLHFSRPRCILLCVIEVKRTKVNDPGQKNATWYLKVSNFNEFFQKKMHKMAVFYVSVNIVSRKRDDRTDVSNIPRHVNCVLSIV